MTYFLAKTEPGVYSIDDLKRDGQTMWDGVRNPQALRAVRAMKPKDRILIYHSGGESQIVGVGEVAGQPEPDPKDAKSWRVAVKYVRHVDPAVTLKQVKESGLFDSFALVRQSRLSTMEVPSEFVDWLRQQTKI
jgi:predicted RNA-binding protein with PUA-like domain